MSLFVKSPDSSYSYECSSCLANPAPASCATLSLVEDAQERRPQQQQQQHSHTAKPRSRAQPATQEWRHLPQGALRCRTEGQTGARCGETWCEGDTRDTRASTAHVLREPRRVNKLKDKMKNNREHGGRSSVNGMRSKRWRGKGGRRVRKESRRVLHAHQLPARNVTATDCKGSQYSSLKKMF